ncbi:hypothetical protein V8J36_13040 [Frigidibacter sp. MR17.14]|uniref:hypothetical protein n=1 Tax=Frigidibacter sp. MR17.14 TaxID=3126509 RepID=UPI003012B966
MTPIRIAALLGAGLALTACNGPIGGVGAFGNSAPAPAYTTPAPSAPVFTPDVMPTQESISTTSLG